MTPRIVLVSSKHWLAAAMCTGVLIVGLACGKYGKPERIPQPERRAPASADLDERATESDSAEAEKKRKR